MRVKIAFDGELRRFIPKNEQQLKNAENAVEEEFQNIQQFVKCQFGVENFRLQYADEEKELITIGTANEYLEAMTVAKEDGRKSLKLHVIKTASKSKTIANTRQKREFIDTRSDTVTLPTEEMRQAMAAAPVGDDVYGEDPTVIELERLSAEFLGKEAALFVSSGTMGNFLALLTHADRRGSEIIVGDSCHIYTAEQGGCSHLGGIHSRSVPTNDDGTLDLDKIEAAIQGVDCHNPVTRLICLENTHNSAGGKVLSLEYMESVRNLADQYELPVHLDGARVYNAAHALGVSVARVCRDVDTVNMCYSKGLAAPVGSILAGSKEFIDKARYFRKAVGGGTRQAGIIAAACIVSLQSIYPRIPEDHSHAQLLAAELNTLPFMTVETPETNLVFFSVDYSQLLVDNAQELSEYLESMGILSGGGYTTVRIRMAMHNDITTPDVYTIAEAFQALPRVTKSDIKKILAKKAQKQEVGKPQFD